MQLKALEIVETLLDYPGLGVGTKIWALRLCPMLRLEVGRDPAQVLAELDTLGNSGTLGKVGSVGHARLLKRMGRALTVAENFEMADYYYHAALVR